MNDQNLPRFLVVDDSESDRKLIVSMLEGKAMCDLAKDGFEAWSLYVKSLTRQRYDLMLLDLNMPNLSGLKLLKLIRNNEDIKIHEHEPKLPVLIISAYEEMIVQATDFDDYMVKPVEHKAFIEKVNRLIKTKQIA